MTEHETKITEAVGKVLPAVASITIAKEVKDITKDLPLEFFRLPHYQEFLEHEIQHAQKDDKGRIKVGGGSGFFISDDGIILTNRHVVQDKHATYDIGTSDGKNFEAEVVARDPINDVAILKVKNLNGKRSKKYPFLVPLITSRFTEVGRPRKNSPRETELRIFSDMADNLDGETCKVS